MQPCVNIGNQVDMKQAAEPLADALVKLLTVISDKRIDRETGLAAINALSAIGSVSGVTISNCDFGFVADPSDRGPAQ